MPPVERVAAPLSRRLFGGRLLWGLPVVAALLSRPPAVVEAGTDGDWTLAGNSLPDATRFLGSTNAQPVTIKTGNVARVIITAIGRVGIGTTAPAAKLDVATSLNPAIRGNSTATGGVGVKGEASSASGAFSSGIGVSGSAPNDRDTAPNAIGVKGQATTGVQGTGVFVGVQGTSANYGLIGTTTPDTQGTGVYGRGAIGVRGTSYAGLGVQGETSIGTGVKGESYNDGGDVNAIYGQAFGAFNNGVVGEANNGTGAYGIWGKSTSGYAGVFSGKVAVYGTLSKSAGSFKIDHPQDPENQYLSHSFVESPDMLNVYNGTATLGADGSVEIELPPYFEALNRDFRYQLTCLGAFAPVYVSKKVAGNRFSVAGGSAGLEVSWQVTGIRQDAFANANRIPVEEPKAGTERGRYLHPKEHGKPEEAGLDYERAKGLSGKANGRAPEPPIPASPKHGPTDRPQEVPAGPE